MLMSDGVWNETVQRVSERDRHSLYVRFPSTLIVKHVEDVLQALGHVAAGANVRFPRPTRTKLYRLVQHLNHSYFPLCLLSLFLSVSLSLPIIFLVSHIHIYIFQVLLHRIQFCKGSCGEKRCHTRGASDW